MELNQGHNNSLDILAEVSGISVSIIHSIFQYCIAQLLSLQESIFTEATLNHNKITRQIRRYSTFISMNGRLYLYGCVDTEDDEQTHHNLRKCFKNDLNDLNTILKPSNAYKRWEDIKNIGEFLENKPSARHALMTRCSDEKSCCLHGLRNLNKARTWLRQVYKTLPNLNFRLQTDFVYWSDVILDPDNLTPVQTTELMSKLKNDQKTVNILVEQASLDGITEHNNNHAYIHNLFTPENVDVISRVFLSLPDSNLIGKVELLFVSITAYFSKISRLTWYTLMLGYISRSVNTDSFIPIPPITITPSPPPHEGLEDLLLKYYNSVNGSDLSSLQKIGKVWGKVFNNRQELKNNIPPTSLPTFISFIKRVNEAVDVQRMFLNKIIPDGWIRITSRKIPDTDVFVGPNGEREYSIENIYNRLNNNLLNRRLRNK